MNGFRLLLLTVVLAIAGCARAETRPDSPVLDRSGFEKVFDEDFSKAPDFYDPALRPAGRWKTNFWFSVQDGGSPRGWEARTLRPNKELEYYGDPLHGTDPFKWQPGALEIIAQTNPFIADPRTHALPYLSGLLTTEPSFSQLYGYFEARITMPVGTGLWPAFWLLPMPKRTDGQVRPVGQQEIDIFENIGKPDELWLTVHHDVHGKKVADGEKITGIAATEPHTYGLLLTKDVVAWYIDDRLVRQRPNVDFHDPAYMLINLAVGGTWPGSPDASTAFPATMKIEWVRAYRLKK